MPSKVLALGKTAIHELTPERGTIEELRGKRVPSPELEDYTELRVTYHPSPLALNTNPARSAQFDEDVAWVGEP